MEWAPVVVDGRALTSVPPFCGDCSEKRDEAVAREERKRLEKRRREEHEARKERIHELLHESGANPWAHGHATLEAWDPSDAGKKPVEAATRLLDDVRDAGEYDPVRGLYLHGPTGAGKTFLATGVVRELLIDGWSPETIRMDHAAAFITEVQDCYGSERSVIDVKEKRERARLWVLDDLGTERPSDDVVRVLTEILNRREGRATLITSNLPPQKIGERHPELARVVSRLGPRYFEVVKVEGRDRRHDTG